MYRCFDEEEKKGEEEGVVEEQGRKEKGRRKKKEEKCSISVPGKKRQRRSGSGNSSLTAALLLHCSGEEATARAVASYRKLAAESSETRRQANLTESERKSTDSDGVERQQRRWRVAAPTTAKSSDCNNGGEDQRLQ
ncbi:hypothetical protein GW17_00025540 [Ensete ventricosum]|nr:hypothetical protein GW17_00025540 [Ensete ventricosum]